MILDKKTVTPEEEQKLKNLWYKMSKYTPGAGAFNLEKAKKKYSSVIE